MPGSLPLPGPDAYAFIDFDPAGRWESEVAEFAGGQPADFEPADLAPLEAALAAAVAQQNEVYERVHGAYWQANPTSSFNRELVVIDLPRYVRQVVTFQTPDGRRLVWVQLVRYPRSSWRTRPSWHEDGGSNYVGALYEPARDHLHWLRPGGRC